MAKHRTRWALKTYKNYWPPIQPNTTLNFRSKHRRCSFKKKLLKILQNSQKNTCARVFFFNKVAGHFIKQETLAQVFS